MKDVVLVCKTVFRDSRYLFVFLALSLGMFWLFLATAAKTAPGNGGKEFFLLAVLSFLTGLSIVFHIYTLRQKASVKTGVSMVGQGGAGFLSGAIAIIFGTAACTACVAALFGFLGVGSVLFLVQYRMFIVTIAIILMLISLYFTAQRLLHLCNCE